MDWFAIGRGQGRGHAVMRGEFEEEEEEERVWEAYNYFLTYQPNQRKPTNIGLKTTQNEFEMATAIF